MTKNFNFSNPMDGRKWLRLLRDDPVSGIRILPDLDLPVRKLGFSFRSNTLGLRGPADTHAPNVVIGSSFGMGFAVDNGRNWYENSLEGPWLNISLPVGVCQLEALLNTYHRGAAQTALVLYHPNFWVQTRLYDLCSRRGSSVFQGMGWQTDLWPCLKLTLRRLRRRSENIRKGELLVFRRGGRTYEMDTRYNHYDFGAWTGPVGQVIETMQRMLDRFARVLVIRTLLKQDMVPADLQNSLLQETLQNHERGWKLFQESLDRHPGIRFFVTRGFALEDFFPLDNHWTPQGNDKFARMVRQVLATGQDSEE